ncbi:hypothetical protein H6G54_18065 [Anabaena cylindrica FACHB-243]|nr:hypothetical protein [Anabaena cylindrica]MBD2419573.1 hypothetical protein [Anabaena cylindrica FACHB-243]MBY5309322.1 hypothetical protein [Anabaena sp. CCAP 1446/1C]MCM2409767.1 hypothetical protein [Anabaena sp. CCAP 1446/1C]
MKMLLSILILNVLIIGCSEVKQNSTSLPDVAANQTNSDSDSEDNKETGESEKFDSKKSYIKESALKDLKQEDRDIINNDVKKLLTTNNCTNCMLAEVDFNNIYLENTHKCNCN